MHELQYGIHRALKEDIVLSQFGGGHMHEAFVEVILKGSHKIASMHVQQLTVVFL